MGGGQPSDGSRSGLAEESRQIQESDRMSNLQMQYRIGAEETEYQTIYLLLTVVKDNMSCKLGDNTTEATPHPACAQTARYKEVQTSPARSQEQEVDGLSCPSDQNRQPRDIRQE